MADFASLLRGSLQMARVIIPEDASRSWLIEVVETEHLSQGGGKVSAAGLATLKKRVADKIQFDGPNPRVPPACLVPITSSQPAVPGKVTVVRASGNESVSFSLDLAPIFGGRCSGCSVRMMPPIILVWRPLPPC